MAWGSTRKIDLSMLTLSVVAMLMMALSMKALLRQGPVYDAPIASVM